MVGNHILTVDNIQVSDASLYLKKKSILGGLRDRPSLPDVVNPSQQNHQDPPMYPHRDPDGKILKPML